MASKSSALYIVILVIIVGAFIASVYVYLMGISPQAGTIISPLLGGVIVYSGFFFFLTHPQLFTHISIGLKGIDADLQNAKNVADAITAEQNAAARAEGIACEPIEEINEIQKSGASARDILLQLANEIETKIRIISELHQQYGYKYESAAAYAELLQGEGLISQQLEHLIASFLEVRNKVVHSTGDLSASQLEAAIDVGGVILTELHKTYELSSDR